MTDRKTAGSIDAYIAGFPAPTQEALQTMRALIREAAPEATETTSYGACTFAMGAWDLVHFAGFARHIGFYPVPTGIEAFRAELAAFKTGKGSVQFPLGEPLPADLIRRIVAFRMRELEGRDEA